MLLLARRRLLPLLLLLLAGAGAAVAQQVPGGADVPYYSADTLRVRELALAQRASVQQYFGSHEPAGVSGEYRAHYRRLAREAATDVYNSVRYAGLLDPVLEPYVQRVFQQIRQANPQLPVVQLVLSRSPEPNAHAVGNGTVVLNVGLLARLENDSQLAYVLCHELAHVQVGHMQAGLRRQLATLHSKELRQQVRRIIAEEYNINSRLKTLALGLRLGSTYHQRQYEKQADSLGYVLLRRTPGFDAAQARRVLELLDTVDGPLVAGPLDLDGVFGCATHAYPGPAAAPPKPRSIFTVAAAAPTTLETGDTLKSHPDCAKRLRYLAELTGSPAGAAASNPAAPAGAGFARVQALARLEAVQSWLDYDCYDHALYDALQLLQTPGAAGSSYLRELVLVSLLGLRQHLEGHRFTEVVGNVSPHNAASFNQLLTALYAWRTEDYAGLAACFAQGGPALPPAATDEYALAARYAAAALAAAPEAAALAGQYRTRYPRGRFGYLLPPVPAGRAGR